MNKFTSSALVALVLVLGLQGAARDGSASSAAAAPYTPTNDIAVVVPASNPVSNLTMAELRRIYMGERKYWKNGSAVVVLMRARGAAERDVMLRVVYQMEEDQYAQYWVGKIMQAEATAPPADVFSSGMISQGVENISGAIGYMNPKDVRSGRIKVVRIGGLLPGERGYPLH